MQTWDKDTLRRAVVDVSDHSSSVSTRGLYVHGSVVAAAGSSASLVAVFGGLHVLVDICSNSVGSGHDHKPTKHPIFDLRLPKRCLHKVFPSVFGTLDPFSMMEFVTTRLKGAEHRDCMISRSIPLRANIPGEVSMPSLVKVICNIVDEWPVIVVHSRETAKRQKADGDSLV